MLVLAIDTSTPQVTAGIVDTNPADAPAPRTLAFRAHLDARAHNEVLTPLILDCLTEAGVARADLGAVVVGHGPGPFTGLRVGMATAAAFADALSIPVHGVGSLDAIALGVGKLPEGARVLAVTDARRREVYHASFEVRDGRPVRVGGPAVDKPADLAGAPDVIVGSAKHAALVAEVLGGEVREAYPTPEGLVAAVTDGVRDDALVAQPKPLVPAYLRRPDAVPPKPRPRSAALPDPATVPGALP